MNGSIGFNVKNGQVYIDNEIVYTFNFMEEIQQIYKVDDSRQFDFNGCAFGIGMDVQNQQFFFSFNGRILNSLSFQTVGEMRFQVYNKIRKDELEQDEKLHKVSKLQGLATKLGLKKDYKDEIKKINKFKVPMSNAVPMIFIQRSGKFYVNIGGAPFMVRERQIKTGVLKKKLC